MKDHLLQTVSAAAPEQRRNLAREYLQVYILRLLHAAGAFSSLEFLGGTALRLLYRLPRYSEDLGFSLTADSGPTCFDPEALFGTLATELKRAGYIVTVKQKASRTVASAFVRFPGLPQAIGWTSDPRLALSIRLEIDQNPPAGAVCETTLVQRFFPIALRHHNLPSLFAGKVHALLTRPYAKGRDWFDLVWYLTEQRGLTPNLSLLEAALQQTGHRIKAATWRRAVCVRLESLDWKAVVRDLSPFLERQDDLTQLTPELVTKLVRG
jgi:hypothetical protein